MEVENKMYADMHGEGQPAPGPPQYTPTPAPPQSHGYPPYGPSAMAASPYYAPPSGAGYGGGYVPPPPPQQQQQVTIVTANPSPVVYVQPGVQSFTCAKLYSCFVCWCCGCLFGLIAFILAMIASDKAATDAQGARTLGRASYIVSTVGIVVAIIVVGVYFGAFYFRVRSECTYNYDGVCYRYSSPFMTFDECLAKGGFYDNGCYYS